MIFIKRSLPEPAALTAERQKPNGNYKHVDILTELQKIFFGRCYLCEDTPQSINVEHLVPHEGDKNLEFLWGNLFWACFHCNNIKGARYKSILDCTANEEVEKRLRYEMDAFPTEDVLITPTAGSPTISDLETQELLLEVFNGTTDQKTLEANSLRRKICEDLNHLNSLILAVTGDSIGANQKRAFLLELDSHLSENARFASFKRWAVKKRPKIYEQLKNMMDLSF